MQVQSKSQLFKFDKVILKLLWKKYLWRGWHKQNGKNIQTDASSCHRSYDGFTLYFLTYVYDKIFFIYTKYIFKKQFFKNIVQKRRLLSMDLPYQQFKNNLKVY